MAKSYLIGFVMISLLFASGCANQTEKLPDVENQTPVNISDSLHNLTDVSDETEIVLAFSSGGCEDSINVRDQSKLGIKEALWVDDELHIKAFVLINCAESILGGSYNLSNKSFVLNYNKTQCDVCTTCNCVHQLSYIFKNVPKNEYKFELKSYSQQPNFRKEIDELNALHDLSTAGCWYTLSDKSECMTFEEPYWTIQKEGCLGKCKINYLTGEIIMDFNPMCTGLSTSCNNNTDCLSIRPNCASKYICDDKHCIASYK